MAESVDASEDRDRPHDQPSPPNKDELAKAKESILNSFIFRYDSQVADPQPADGL